MNIIRTALAALLLAASTANAAWPPEWDAERNCLERKLQEAFRHECSVRPLP